MSEHAEHRAHPHDAGHVVPPATYFAVFAALMALTVITVAASRMDLGALNTPVALAVAVTKALLVILFFMHLKYSSRLIWLVAAAAAFWLFHLIAGTTADYASRGRVNPETRTERPLSLEDR